MSSVEDFLGMRSPLAVRLSKIRSQGHLEVEEERREREAAGPVNDELARLKAEMLRLEGTPKGPPVQTDRSPSRGARSHRSPRAVGPIGGSESQSPSGRMQVPSETLNVQSAGAPYVFKRPRRPSASSNQAGDAK